MPSAIGRISSGENGGRVGEQVRQRRPGDQLHDDVEGAVGEVAGGVEGGHVRRAHRLQRGGLAAEAGGGGGAAGVRGLDGDATGRPLDGPRKRRCRSHRFPRTPSMR
jgi:hypothetical protein